MTDLAGDAVIDRLDRLTQVIELALAPQLKVARAELREDPVNSAVLSAAAGRWKAAGPLQKEVEAKTKKKKRTVQISIGELTDRGYLEKRGGGPSTEYRTNPVVDG